MTQIIRKHVKTTNKTSKNTKGSICRVALYIDPEANQWNRAAIELSEKREKIHSHCDKNIIYPVVSRKKKSSVVQMSTNEWNSMALELVGGM